MNGTDIVGLTFKLLNPGVVMRVLESEKGRKREREGAREVERERVGVDGLVGVRRAEERRQRGGLGGCETVKQDDSAGLSFERLPACQFQCNVFIDTLLAAT